ncbi:uncharacterized protein LOC122853052 isoform X2 [Aphidius gifuensis]|uniref:uncharacterized protein LOC122853052 isoform X2 n=1 Tax=Aphidius gifuensis TaxID=684658 RepID=UPI001CDD3643|nr:uncharacterized protein LOC122853052 isoform X2 [Aphidius gifuensis]
MQNWNQWQQLPTASATGSQVPQPPSTPGYPAGGADPMTTMQAYMQYYNQPAPSGYTAEQWTAAQQQNWLQWQQWQQQYQQWQAQYGSKYQNAMKQLEANTSGVPPVPTAQPPPPLPKEDSSIKPPLPPDSSSYSQKYGNNSNLPLPHQNNLPLYPTKTTSNPPLPPDQPPPPPGNPPNDNISGNKRTASNDIVTNSSKKSKNEEEELTEAEKTFDEQFKQWEEQFNKWKQQNANHPDKVQYKQYEAKWTSWREKLIERREQMRKKREAQRAKAEAEKKKNLQGGENILNILSTTENAGLLNNLLGIGKTLGLTGKEAENKQSTQQQQQQQPAATTTTTTTTEANMQNTPMGISGVPPTMTSDMNQHAWAAQQWAAQYNMVNMSMPAYSTFQTPMVPPPIVPPSTGIQQNTNVADFNQPPPPNFTQPPPGFPVNSMFNNNNSGLQDVKNTQDQNKPPYQSDNDFSKSSYQKDTYDQSDNSNKFNNQFDSDDRRRMSSSNDRYRGNNDSFNRDGPGRMDNDSGNNNNNRNNNNFSNDRYNNQRDRSQNRDFGGNNRGNFGNDNRNDSFDNRDNFGGNRSMNDDHFNRNDRNRFDEPSRFDEQNRFGGDRNDRNFNRNRSNDRFGNDNNRFNNDDNNDRFNMSSDRFGSSANKFDSGNSNQQDRWNKDNSNVNRGSGRTSRFEQKQQNDDITPEIQKLMEKRRAAGDVFKPSFGNFSTVDEPKNNAAGSLGETFRKIAGDPPFLPRERPDFGRKSPGRHSFGPGSDSNRFRGGDDDSQSRDVDSFRSSGPGNFRSSDNFSHSSPIVDNSRSRRSRTDDFRPGNFGRDMEHQDRFQSKIPPLEIPPWMDSQLMPSLLSGKNSEFGGSQLSENTNKFSDRDTDDRKNKKDTDKLTPSLLDSQNIIQPFDVPRKSDDLPFMGKNDPKPEDLNMEPPPELPNLGPIKPPPLLARDDNILPFDNRSRDSLNNRPGLLETPFGNRSMPPVVSQGTRELGPAFEVFNTRNNDLPVGNFGPRDAGPGRDLPFNFGARGPGSCGPRDLDDFGPRGLDNFGPGGPDNFGPRGPDNFGPRGPDNFGPRGPDNFGPRGLDNFGPRGPDDFGPCGPDNFGPRGPDNFGPRGPDDFGPRGPNNFGPRGPDNFGPCGPDDFGSRGPDNFGPRGPDNFGPRGPDNFGPRGPDNFGPRGPDNFGPCGPDDFGPRGPDNFGPRGPDNFGPRGPDDFGPRNLDNFGPRGPDDIGPRGIDNFPPFGPRGPDNFNRQEPNNFGPCGPDNFGPRDFPDRPFGPPDVHPLRGPDDLPLNRESNMSNNTPNGPRGSIPSLLSFKIEPPPILPDALIDNNSMDRQPMRPRRDELDRPPIDINPVEKNVRPPLLPDPRDFPSHIDLDRDIGRSPLLPNRGCDDRMFRRPDQSIISGKPPIDNILPPMDYQDNEFSRRPDGHRREEPTRNFCAGKQFDYNHGARAEVLDHYVPSKVIDYGHVRIPTMQDYRILPSQSFDYAHGTIKPIVPEHKIYPKIDFNYWLDNEHNVNEYNEGMRMYQARKIAIIEERARMAEWQEEKRRYEEKMRYDELKRYDNRPSPWERESRDSRRRQRNDDSRDYKRHQDWRDSRNHDFPRDRSEGRGRDRSRDNDYNRNRDDNFKKNEDRTRDKSDRTRRNALDFNKDEESDKNDKTVVESSNTMDVVRPSNYTMVEDLLCSPGRQNRPQKIVIILRGPPGGGKSFIAKLIKDKEMEQGGSAPRILSLDDYFLTEKDVESKDDNGKKIINKEMVYEYEEAMESSYITSLIKAFKKNVTDGFFNFIILDSINEKISDYEEMWNFAKTKGFKVYVCEMEMDSQICIKRNIHGRTDEEINRIVDYFEPTPNYHQKLDVTSLLQEQAIQDVHMEEAEIEKDEAKTNDGNDDSQDNFETSIVSKWEIMESDNKLDRLDGLAKRKNDTIPQTMEDFLQVPDYYNSENTSGKRRVRWADLEEKKEQEKMRAMGFVIGHTNWDRMMDPTGGSSALTKTKYI